MALNTETIADFPSSTAPLTGAEQVPMLVNGVTSRVPASAINAGAFAALNVEITAIQAELGALHAPLSFGTVVLNGATTFVPDTNIVADSQIQLLYSAQNNAASLVFAGTLSVVQSSIIPGQGFTITSSSLYDESRVGYVNSIGATASGTLPTSVPSVFGYDFSQNNFPRTAIQQRYAGTAGFSGVYWNAAGTRVYAQPNSPRMDYGPYLAGWLAGTPYTTALLVEFASTNFFIGADAPASQAIVLPVGTYFLWVRSSVANQATSTDSATVSAGTATITGAGTATNSSGLVCTNATTTLGGKYTYGQWLQFAVTVSGTVNVAIAGAPVFVQLESNLGFAPSSDIPTPNGTPVLRPEDQVQVLTPYQVSVTNGGTVALAFLPAATYAGVGAGYMMEMSEGDTTIFTGFSIVGGTAGSAYPTGSVQGYGGVNPTSYVVQYGVPVCAAKGTNAASGIAANGQFVANGGTTAITSNVTGAGQGQGTASGNNTTGYNVCILGGHSASSGSFSQSKLHGWIMNAAFFPVYMTQPQITAYTSLWPSLFPDPITPAPAPTQRTTLLQRVAAAGQPLLGLIPGTVLYGGVKYVNGFEQWLGRRVEMNLDYTSDSTVATIPSFSSNISAEYSDQVQTFQGSISGTTLTINAYNLNGYTAGPGCGVSGSTTAAGTYIIAQLTGSPGQTGTYSVNISQSVAYNLAMTLNSDRFSKTPQFCPTGTTAYGPVAVSNRNFAASVAMCTGDATLAQIAAGTYDTDYTGIASHLGTYYPKACIRLGWEFNGTPGSFPWQYSGSYTPANFIAAFQHLVTLFKTYSSDFTFSFCPISTQYGFNGTSTALDWEASYPGDAYVDVLDMDIYFNQHSMLLNPNAPGEGAWEQTLGGPRGLLALRAFATMHGKFIGFSEYAFGNGQGTNPSGTAVTPSTADLSAAYKRFANFLNMPGNNCAWHNQWHEVANGFYGCFSGSNGLLSQLVPAPYTISASTDIAVTTVTSLTAVMTASNALNSPLQVMMRGTGCLLCQPSVTGAAVGTGFGVVTDELTNAQALSVVGGTGGVSSTVLTVTAGSGITPGMCLAAGNAPRILNQLTGTYGGAGTYLLSSAVVIAAGTTCYIGQGSLQSTITAAGNVNLTPFGANTWATMAQWYFPNTAAVYYHTIGETAPFWNSN